MSTPPLLVVENDPFLRMLEVILDPQAPPERYAAFADFFAHEEPDFAGYCKRVHARAPALSPARVRLVDTQEALRAASADADAVVVEALAFGGDELAAAPKVKLLQKYGVGLAAIDTEACAARGVTVLTIAGAPTSPAPSTRLR